MVSFVMLAYNIILSKDKSHILSLYNIVLHKCGWEKIMGQVTQLQVQ